MSSESPLLPQAPRDVDSAMALVCSVPAPGRGERRVSVQAVVSQATSFDEVENGVLFRFENSDDVARLLLDLVLAERRCCARFSYSMMFQPEHQAIELRVEGAGDLIQPLKDLYLGLAVQSGAEKHV